MTIQESTGVARLSGLLIENNRAYVGGGIEILSIAAFSVVSDDFRPTVIRNNTAVTGGGLYYRAGLYPLLLFRVKHIIHRPVLNLTYRLRTVCLSATERCRPIPQK